MVRREKPKKHKMYRYSVLFLFCVFTVASIIAHLTFTQCFDSQLGVCFFKELLEGVLYVLVYRYMVIHTLFAVMD